MAERSWMQISGANFRTEEKQMNKSIWGGSTGRAALKASIIWGMLLYIPPQSPLLSCYPESSLPSLSSFICAISHALRPQVLLKTSSCWTTNDLLRFFFKWVFIALNKWIMMEYQTPWQPGLGAIWATEKAFHGCSKMKLISVVRQGVKIMPNQNYLWKRHTFLIIKI